MRTPPITIIIAGCILMAGLHNANATPIDQYASYVIDFSSQYSSPDWAAEQALGPPDTFTYGDYETAWSAEEEDGTLEYISLGFDTAVFADSVTIRESSANGFVYQVDVIDLADTLHTVWSGTDPTLPGELADFVVSWTPTNYLVDGVKIYVDTSHLIDEWEEIDSVQLHGEAPSFVPEPSGLALLALGLAGAGFSRKKKHA